MVGVRKSVHHHTIQIN